MCNLNPCCPPPLALGDSNDGANTSEDRCKSPTSGEIRSYQIPTTVALHAPGVSFKNKSVWNAAICHIGSTSPCNSDDERKQKFIEKGSVSLTAAWPLHFCFWQRCRCLIYVFEPISVKYKSRRFSKTVAIDFGTVSPRCTPSLPPSLSLNDGVLTTLCLNPVFVHLVRMKEGSALGKKKKKTCVFSTNHIVLKGHGWFMWLIKNLFQLHDRTPFEFQASDFLCRALQHVAGWLENIPNCQIIFN